MHYFRIDKAFVERLALVHITLERLDRFSNSNQFQKAHLVTLSYKINSIRKFTKLLGHPVLLDESKKVVPTKIAQ